MSTPRRGRKEGRDGRKRRKGSTAPRAAGEWIGLRVPADPAASGQFLVWLEASSKLVVGCELALSGGSTLVDVLKAALAAPNIGLARIPQRLRVADEADAAAVAQLMPELMPDASVVVGEVPDAAWLAGGMARVLGETHDRSGRRVLCAYTPDGMTAGLAHRLFGLASLFLQVAPWSKLGTGDLLRVSVPSLGLDEACVSVMGGEGLEFGLLLFPSFAAFNNYLEAMQAQADMPWKSAGREMDFLALNFEHERELGRTLPRELGQYGFPREGPEGWPVVMRRAGSNKIVQPTATEIAQVLACVEAVVIFLSAREAVHDEPVSFTTEDDAQGTVEGPFGLDGAPQVFAAPSREKLATAARVSVDCEPLASAADRLFVSRQHVRLDVLDRELCEYAETAFGAQWRDALEMIEGGGDPIAPLMVEAPSLCDALHLYEFPDAEDAIAGGFIDQREPLAPALVPALRAQREARTDVWAVEHAESDTHVFLRRLGQGNKVKVHDCALAASGKPGDCLLARLVTLDGERILRGVLPFVLPETAAEQCRAAAFTALNLAHDAPLPPDSRGLFTLALLIQWQDVAGRIGERPRR